MATMADVQAALSKLNSAIRALQPPAVNAVQSISGKNAVGVIPDPALDDVLASINAMNDLLSPPVDAPASIDPLVALVTKPASTPPSDPNVASNGP